MKKYINIDPKTLEVLSDAESSILYKIDEDGRTLLMEMDLSLFRLDDIRKWMSLGKHWYANCKYVVAHIYDRPVNLNKRKRIGTARISRSNIVVI